MHYNVEIHTQKSRILLKLLPEFQTWNNNLLGAEASILGGGGGAVAPNENIGGQNISFPPPPQ